MSYLPMGLLRGDLIGELTVDFQPMSQIGRRPTLQPAILARHDQKLKTYHRTTSGPCRGDRPDLAARSDKPVQSAVQQDAIS